MEDYTADMRQYGPQADIWSLGAILYYMVYGVPPLYHRYASYPPPGQFPHPSPEVNDVLRRTLVRNPRARADLNLLLNHPFTRG
jgi:calcium-dependent protein kinase